MTFGLLPAEKAVEWGFINKVVPMDQLANQAQAWADTMMSVPSQTVTSFKRGLNAMLEAQGVWSMKALHAAYGAMGHGSERDKEFYRIVQEKGLRPALEFRDAPHGGRQVGRAAVQRA
jgi:enoyl-CoA hydratase